jgi:hypothetical protein
MKRMTRLFVRSGTHALAATIGFALGIYLLPILTAAESPDIDVIRSAAGSADFIGEFRRDLEDSDPLHWGEGTLYVSANSIAFEGRLAPGPDYRLYLSPRFVETESDFEALKSEMVQIGLVNTFENFMLPVPESIDPADYRAAIVWCESFGQFISAAAYE